MTPTVRPATRSARTFRKVSAGAHSSHVVDVNRTGDRRCHGQEQTVSRLVGREANLPCILECQQCNRLVREPVRENRYVPTNKSFHRPPFQFGEVPSAFQVSKMVTILLSFSTMDFSRLGRLLLGAISSLSLLAPPLQALYRGQVLEST